MALLMEALPPEAELPAGAAAELRLLSCCTSGGCVQTDCTNDLLNTASQQRHMNAKQGGCHAVPCRSQMLLQLQQSQEGKYRKQHRRQSGRVYNSHTIGASLASHPSLPLTSAANGDAGAPGALPCVDAGAASAGCFAAAAAKGDCHGDAVPMSTDGGPPGAAATMQSRGQAHDRAASTGLRSSKHCDCGLNKAPSHEIRGESREHTGLLRKAHDPASRDTLCEATCCSARPKACRLLSCEVGRSKGVAAGISSPDAASGCAVPEPCRWPLACGCCGGCASAMAMSSIQSSSDSPFGASSPCGDGSGCSCSAAT